MYILYINGNAQVCKEGIEGNGPIKESTTDQPTTYIERRYIETWEEVVNKFYELIFYLQQQCGYYFDPLYKISDQEQLLVAGLYNEAYQKDIVVTVTTLDSYSKEDVLATVANYTCDFTEEAPLEVQEIPVAITNEAK